MKKTLILICILFSLVNYSQKMITRTGEIHFNATYPGAVDEVVGINKGVSAIFEKLSGEVVVQAMVKSFRFKIPLMEEHFNENYMESDIYPKANFKGKVLNYNSKNGIFEVEGDLTIHGVTNKVKTKMAFTSEGSKLIISGEFVVKLSDYNLKVPALAKKTLSETAKVFVSLPMEDK